MSRLRLPDPSRFFTHAAGTVAREIVELLNGRLVPADNFQQVVIVGTTPAIAGTSFTVKHDLKRVLAGSNSNDQGAEFVWWLDGPGTVYLVTFDENTLTLKCTDASRNYTIVVR